MKANLLRQFKAIKSKYPDAVVLMLNENEYFTIGQDAEILLSVCGINKTFSITALDQVLQKLVRTGYRVAIAECLEPIKINNNAKAV